MDPLPEAVTARRRRIAANLKAVRRERRLTQRALVKKAGVSLGTLQAAELAQRTIREEPLAALAGALDVTVADLDPPATTDLHVAATVDLNDEDLLVARAYNRAPTGVRQRVQQVLVNAEGGSLIDRQGRAQNTMGDSRPILGQTYLQKENQIDAEAFTLAQDLSERLKPLDLVARASLVNAVKYALDHWPTAAATAADQPRRRRARKTS
jgi:transcriptional regulator with XRE-family HTH domain